METLMLLTLVTLVVVVSWMLFKPFSKSEFENYKNENWPDMNF
tara:strand:+ start:30 stop:158 length:129 start_codon:yes stop_codon:yes gene_type:complete